MGFNQVILCFALSLILNLLSHLSDVMLILPVCDGYHFNMIVLTTSHDLLQILSNQGVAITVGGQPIAADMAIAHLEDFLDGPALNVVAGVAAVNVRLETVSGARILLHQALVHLKRRAHLFVRHIVQEDALAHGADRHGGSEQAVARLEDGGRGFFQQRAVKLRVVHGETGAGEEIEDAAMVLGGKEPANVGKSRRVGHVDGDGMPVTQRWVGNQLMERRPASYM